MATLDLSRATGRINMLDPDIVKFHRVETQTATSWSFNNGKSDDLQLDGTGMVFDSKGKALGGTVTRIGIDLGDNDFDNPDILITGIKAKASMLDDGYLSFWRLLEGDDVILGPDNDTSSMPHTLFGDGVVARNNTTGGNDRFELGADPVDVAGDVRAVGRDDVNASAVTYRGGNDVIVGAETIAGHRISGDVMNANTGSLTGGNDQIYVRGVYLGGRIVGDADEAGGTYTENVTVTGGNDTIVAGDSIDVTIIGDVYLQYGKSLVRGGHDQLRGGDGESHLIGDVGDLWGHRAIGGNDELWGEGGDDILMGDALELNGGDLTGGRDTLHGGVGNDYLFGDGPGDGGVKDGHDRLYGNEGYDWLFGGGGNDLLNGGSDIDQMRGGTGNDTYVVVDDDNLFENAGEGVDTVLTANATFGLTDNIENLTFTGTGSFSATGNVLANVIKGSSGADFILGLAGKDKLIGGAHNDSLYGGLHDDVLIGGAGADQLDGGEGYDIASYEGSEKGVNASLDGSIPTTGDAREDTFLLVEGLRGSSYGDALAGNDDNNLLEGGGGDDALLGLGGTDVLVGGKGLDNLTGGADADRFVFTATSESDTTKSTRDVIRDFTKGQDLIDLAAIDANTGVAGNNAFKLLAKGAEDSAVGTGRIGWYQINQPGTGGDKTILRINNDADAAIDMTIEIRGLVSFAAGDFVL